MVAFRALLLLGLLSHVASESVATLDDNGDAENAQSTIQERWGFGGLSTTGSFTIVVATFEKKKEAQLGAAASMESGNENTNFVCPPGADPEGWITTHDVENSAAKVHCVAAPDGSDKNDKDLRFVATGGNTGEPGNGKHKYGSGNNKPEYSVFKGNVDLEKQGNIKNEDTIASMPCTIAAVAQTQGTENTGMMLHGESGTERQFKSKRAMFRSVEGTKTCTALATYLQTGSLELGVEGQNGWWTDKLWVRTFKLTVCVFDSSADTFGEAGGKCKDIKYVSQCMIGDSSNNAVDCDEGTTPAGITSQESANMAAML